MVPETVAGTIVGGWAGVVVDWVVVVGPNRVDAATASVSDAYREQ